MKYQDPVTGEIKTVAVKAADSLPIGTIVEYEGAEIPKGYELIEDEVILYENENGTTGDITLSETSKNFRYIEIYYYSDNSNGYTGKGNYYTKVYNPNGKNVNIKSTLLQDGSVFHIRYCDLSISEKKITHGNEVYGNIIGGSTGTVGASSSKILKITRIVGFK